MATDEVDARGPGPMLASYLEKTMNPVSDRIAASGGQ